MKVIERPKAWPSFTFIYQKMEIFLDKFTCWKSKIESRSANRCAFLVAESAVMDRCVAGWEAGSMRWMGDGSILSVRKKTGWKDGEDGRLAVPFNPI